MLTRRACSVVRCFVWRGSSFRDHWLSRLRTGCLLGARSSTIMCEPGTSREQDRDAEPSDSDEDEEDDESEHPMRDDDIVDDSEPPLTESQLLEREFYLLREHWVNVPLHELIRFRLWVVPLWRGGISLHTAFVVYWPRFREADMMQ